MHSDWCDKTMPRCIHIVCRMRKALAYWTVDAITRNSCLIVSLASFSYFSLSICILYALSYLIMHTAALVWYSFHPSKKMHSEWHRELSITECVILNSWKCKLYSFFESRMHLWILAPTSPKNKFHIYRNELMTLMMRLEVMHPFGHTQTLRTVDQKCDLRVYLCGYVCLHALKCHKCVRISHLGSGRFRRCLSIYILLIFWVDRTCYNYSQSVQTKHMRRTSIFWLKMSQRIRNMYEMMCVCLHLYSMCAIWCEMLQNITLSVADFSNDQPKFVGRWKVCLISVSSTICIFFSRFGKHWTHSPRSVQWSKNPNTWTATKNIVSPRLYL